MFLPKFSLTPQLSSTLQEIERLYGRLEGMRIPQQLLLNLEHKNLVQSTYASNSIEGNPLNLAEVTNLLLNDRVPVNRSEKEVANYFNILKNLDRRIFEPLDTSLTLTLHKELLNGVNDKIAGKIRNEPVVVGGLSLDNKIIVKHNPPFHDQVSIEKSLNELFDWLSQSQEPAMLTAGIFHHQFVFIHPFVDGNGRVCRLATALFFLKNKYLINKYFILDDYYDVDRDQYSNKLHSADYKTSTNWLEYFTAGVKYSLQSSLGKIESGLEKLDYNLRPTPKENEVLNIIKENPQATSAKLVEILSISRQQASNLLKALTKKGYLEKRGKTKNSYYILK